MSPESFLALVGVFWAGQAGGQTDISRGFGSGISWVESLPKAKEESLKSGKTLMLVIHKPWCGSCQALKPKFAASTELLELSKNFVMFNTEDDTESSDPQYAPDGGYIPRVIFIGPNGSRLDIQNKNGNPNYKFYYSDPSEVVDSMKRILELRGTTNKEL